MRDIAKTYASTPKPTWQEVLKDLVTQPEELAELLQLNDAWLKQARQACQLFPLRVPRRFITRIEKRNPQDPLLKQILPVQQEFDQHPSYSQDPLKEKNVNPISGLLHKYHGRVLLTLTGACAINCRYCFRRHFPYQENNPGSIGWNHVMDYIAKDRTITEVILSGGDPLLVKDSQLKSLLDKLEAISHVKRLRIHSRLPIVVPERMTAKLLQILQTVRLQVSIVIHCNHPNEIDEDVQQGLVTTQKTNITLLNQSVLLNGVNDNQDILIALSEKLFASGVLPYYLHMPDKVSGTTHFAVSQEKAKFLMQQLSGKLPGYLVPKLVFEQAEADAKLLLF